MTELRGAAAYLRTAAGSVVTASRLRSTVAHDFNTIYMTLCVCSAVAAAPARARGRRLPGGRGPAPARDAVAGELLAGPGAYDGNGKCTDRACSYLLTYLTYLLASLLTVTLTGVTEARAQTSHITRHKPPAAA